MNLACDYLKGECIEIVNNTAKIKIIDNGEYRFYVETKTTRKRKRTSDDTSCAIDTKNDYYQEFYINDIVYLLKEDINVGDNIIFHRDKIVAYDNKHIVIGETRVYIDNIEQ